MSPGRPPGKVRGRLPKPGRKEEAAVGTGLPARKADARRPPRPTVLAAVERQEVAKQRVR
jgi:hypothetical protein